MHSKYNVTWNTKDKNIEKYPGPGHLFPQWSLYAVPEWRRQEQVILILSINTLVIAHVTC